MNVVDSKDANIELVCVWNYIEEKAEDQEVADYAKKKREQLDRLLQGKIESDKNKKDFDKQYAMLIEKELREVQKYDKMMRRKKKWKLWFQY
jgi:hypothetical protein